MSKNPGTCKQLEASRAAAMRSRLGIAILLLASLMVTGIVPATAQSPDDWPQIGLVLRYQGLSSPVAITHAGDGSGRLFIVEQEGRIRVVENGTLLAAPLLDIGDRIACCWEQGLLGLAFPPNFSASGHFYVDYTDEAGNTVISRFQVDPSDPNRADPASEQMILRIRQLSPSHNGGQLAFGTEGYLYIGTGDGTWSRPANQNTNAQDTASLLGKILRIDVEGVAPPPQPSRSAPLDPSQHQLYLPLMDHRSDRAYRIPPDNPFAGVPGYRDEIWALGLRNPWRFSVDPQTGDLYVGDVGQSRWEEVDYLPASDGGGANLGWPHMEADECYEYDPTCSPEGLTLPVAQYFHSADACAIIGGPMVRGQAFPALQDIYLYGDYCTGQIWGMQRQGDQWLTSLLYDAPFLITAFGQDEAGRVYVADWMGGKIYQIVPAIRKPAGGR